MKLIEHPDREALTLAVAQEMTEALGMALKTRDRAVLCLPGGSTPIPVFKALAAARLEWDRVLVIPSDERWVPPDHNRSNARLIRRNLIEQGAGAELIELYAEGLDPAAGAALASERIAPLLPLSVLLLGMGEDMHTASLFPGADGLAAALDAAAPPVLPIMAAATEEPRVTLTRPALSSATESFLMIAGPEKREALERAAALPPEQAPVAAVLKGMIVHYAE
ncbi:6-phosphogluconolactonase [Paracoccus sp. (in: a-proteobacteria)]|uniref:6-phosphogluconolactonase n=1 Tax=Paracoccus sp. TaxID=267 RepID=UPI0026E0D0AB|nr:6-phosphogluconolactonase [Paracoccus sp. (in: a-proteobacteria)]MDO5369985.1 6-phosphogluconolactonase [Paracoccus sp. (in: a-proteobacteria)]